MPGGAETAAVADGDDHGGRGPDAHAGQWRQEVEKREGLQQGRDLLLGGLSLGMGGGDRGRQSAVKRCPEARRQHPPGHACDRGQTAIPDPGARRPVAGPRER